MKKEILKCPKCEAYTIKKQCSECNKKTLTPKPAKYSPEDKYGKYRRKYKQDVIQN
ncbi:MAG: ribosome biogenesis protein [Nanoarchaeota archaeon]|nr:ribosome biogenesis protein [Nanoarchaeota archaeon]|tara:strand:- start:4916 stop:5083 length:168 start_codon:yes stop_codon:yes gene_type:complete